MSALLEGIRILDFTYLLPGPFATMMLSDMGAEVLRVESPSRMDMARLAPPLSTGTPKSPACMPC